jgi:FG-GAP repeat
MKRIFIAGAFILFVAIVQAQNVGIGVPTPIEKLHVAGNIKSDTVKTNVVKITPNAGTGKILTSDAAGNANWQTNNAAAAGNVGFGVWGDCATNGNISEYYPVADATGAAGDEFGFSVSISGNFAIVGALTDDVGANTGQGSVSIYQYTGGNWIFMQKLTDAAGAADDRFGCSVSISGNYAIVGAFADDIGANVDQGSASIYQLSAGTWVLKNKITDPLGATGDRFGESVSISGNYAIVGAFADDIGANVDQGSASVFQLSAGSWIFMQKLTDAAGAAGDGFGASISISGNHAIVGVPLDDGFLGTSYGSVAIYRFGGVTWVFEQKLTDASGAPGDGFGFSVSISGNYVIVGAWENDIGANANQGSARIYQYTGSSWVSMQTLTDAAGTADNLFGYSVSISGNYAIVGATHADVGSNPNWGSAIIYQRVGLGWQKLQYVTDPGGQSGNSFGSSTAIDDTNQRFLIGASDYAGGSGKVVFGKVN